MSTMELFTQRARQILAVARQEAEQLEHGYVGSEHLLLALMRDESGVPSQVLRRNLRLDYDRVRDMVEQMSYSADRVTGSRMDLSSDAKRVIELAINEANRMRQEYVGTEHLLLGLVRQPEGVAISILKRLGVSAEEVRQNTRRVLQEAASIALRTTSTQTMQTLQAARVAPPDLDAARYLRVVFTNPQDERVQVELRVTVAQAKEGMMAFAKALSKNQTGKVYGFDSGEQTRVDFYIED